MWDVCKTAAFENWWAELSEQEQDDVTAIVELLHDLGPQLPFPHSSGVESSRHRHMRELRIQSHGDPIRVFDAFDPKRAAILLIGGNKTGKDKRFYKTLVPNPWRALSLNSPKTSALSGVSASSNARSSCGRR